MKKQVVRNLKVLALSLQYLDSNDFNPNLILISVFQGWILKRIHLNGGSHIVQTIHFMGAFAQRYVCVCATSSPSEHLFSSSGHIVSPLRLKLKPDKVNMLTFLSKNLD